MAIEDSLDVLSSALNTGSIELDVFVRAFRVLAEEQYKSRLLGMRIQERQRGQQSHAAGSWQGVQLPQGDAWKHTSTSYPSLS